MVKIAPSVLSANFAELKKDLDSMKACGADWIHYDVMDGHFVPNISFGYSILNDVAKVTDLYLDVHLMISHPRQYVEQFIKAGANLITFHIESMTNHEDVHELIDYIHQQGKEVGISLKPATPIEDIADYLDAIDLVLVMSVEPGFGGQSFQSEALEKITKLKEMRNDRHYLIEVDGGINAQTGHDCIEAGADVLVAGSYLFHATNRQSAVDSLK